jgi:hypothetical protein
MALATVVARRDRGTPDRGSSEWKASLHDTAAEKSAAAPASVGAETTRWWGTGHPTFGALRPATLVREVRVSHGYLCDEQKP